MAKFLSLVTLIALTSAAKADGDCQNPQPIFGKIVAVCGNQMITYVGNEERKVLGIKTIKSQFELVYCSNAADRTRLNLDINSQSLKSEVLPPGLENYQVTLVKGQFGIQGNDFYGNPIKGVCAPYVDQRQDKDIKYIGSH